MADLAANLRAVADLDGVPCWTVPIPPGTPLLNANQRIHWRQRAARTRVLRDAALVLARAARMPRLERAYVIAEYRPPDRRRRDVANLYPSFKACIDGIVSAGVLPDDSDTYLTGPDMRIGPVVTRGQLVIHVYDATRLRHPERAA